MGRTGMQGSRGWMVAVAAMVIAATAIALVSRERAHQRDQRTRAANLIINTVTGEYPAEVEAAGAFGPDFYRGISQPEPGAASSVVEAAEWEILRNARSAGVAAEVKEREQGP